jgi:TonB-linked SusC/RagA family outer membrane protein
MQLTAILRPGSCLGRPKQFIRVMKLSALFLLAFCLQLSARTTGQTITLSVSNVSMKEVFRAIQQQTGLNILVSEKVLEKTGKVSLSVKDMPVEDVLNICFRNEQLSYAIVDGTIVVKSKPSSTVDLQSTTTLASAPPPIDIHGRVTDSLGNPLVGASVTVKGSRKGTETDANGNFTLTGVNDNAIILISFTGFETRQIALTSNPGLKSGGDISGVPFTLTLIRSTSSLDQVQIIAYGTTTQRLNTGDVTTVTAADIEKQPVSNPLLALEGRVPGLFITQATGLPGSGVTVQIRGQNSIASGNDPFYVIDGVPYVSQLLPNLGQILGGSASGFYTGNPLSYINPSDIESISVLKDAAATAIYGSRAANGAILITTKNGKAGPTKVDINIQNGWGKVTRKLKLLNTQQYLQMRHEAISNDGLTTQPTDYDINGTWDTTRYTDWQKEFIGGTSQYTNVNATVSGGSVNTQYLIGGTYHRETTVFPGDFADQKGSLHFNINSVSPNQKFRIQLSGNYLVDNNQLPSTDLTKQAILFAPDAPPLYNADGSLNWAPNASGISTFYTNPLSYLYNKYQTITNNLVGNALISYQILPGLEIRSSFGYTNMQTNESSIFPLVDIAPELRSTSERFSVYANNNINSWIIEPQVSYKQVIGLGRIEVLAGTTIDQSKANGQQLSGSGYNSDLVLGDIHSAAIVSARSSTHSVYKYNAVFGRINYNWQDKYIIDLTARRDGSSRFGSANQFHNFGAVGASWIFSQEKFIKSNLSFISFGKFRASYGTTGNDQIGDYQFLSLYSPTSVGVAYQGAVGLQPNGLTNPYLQWEETKKLEFGMDIGVLKDRILFNVSYYHNRSSNQLLPYALPNITGFGGITRNFPATVQNTGWEFTLNTTNVKTRDFNWSTHINLSIPQNKLVAFPNLATSPYASIFVIGQPLSLVKEFHLLGVDPATGIFQFGAAHGNITTLPDTAANNAYATALINTSPMFYGGFQNTFQYKGFELDVLFQFVKQKIPNYFFGSYPGNFDEGSGNQPVSVLNHWQKPGDIAANQRYNSDFSLGETFSDAAGSDAAWKSVYYIRLKNLSLSWQIPDIWQRKVHLQNSRLFILAQNLLTITDYLGLDPETTSTQTLPPLRVLTLGVQVGL